MNLTIRYYLLLSCLLFTGISLSQEEAAIWYFGSNAGLDFNSGTPEVLNDGQLVTSEGCSTISDSNGDLLFYSDGITVWDKTHSVMPNGFGLDGNPSSTQSGIIVPNPADSNIYYIFTVTAEAGPDGLRYSEVDISLNNGNGDVTANKNTPLIAPATEKISAVQHKNGNDIWVIAHGWGNNDFLAYEVTAAGINTTPVISSVGAVHDGSSDQSIGYLKFSPNGERLAIARWSENSFIEIFDFDDSTGTVSNPIFIDGIFFQGFANGVYGLEFSTNSELLYVSDTNFTNGDGGGKIHQFDLSSGTAAGIIASDVILYEGTNILGAIQLAIDQKMYLANVSTGDLDAIGDPNVIGTGANYVTDAIDLETGSATFGLPPFIQSFFSVGINFEFTCLGNSTSFSIESSEEVVSIIWDFGDGNTSTDLNPTNTYASSGDYTVIVTVTTEDETKSFERDITINNIPVAFAISDFEVCDDVSNDNENSFDLTLKDVEILDMQSPTEFSVSYFATEDDANNHENILPDTYTNTSNNQEIFAKIYNSANLLCYELTSFSLIVNEFPVINIVPDIITCDNEVADQSQLLIFDQITPTVLGNQDGDTFTVTYHLNQADAISGSSNLPNVYQTISNPQELFFRIENTNSPECFEISSFNVIIDGQIIAFQPEDMFVCDDDSNDGFGSFGLTNQNDQIINGQTDNYTITYYSSEEDAFTNTSALGGSYTNSTNPETIYARIEKVDNPNCFDVTFFDIQVVEQPVFEIQDLYYVCTNETVTIDAPTGFDSYNWSTGEMTSSITVMAPGSYTVTVTRDYPTSPAISCSATKTVQVIESDEAVFQSFEITDWTATNNVITVLIDGIGDYEYSLNNITYQDSNIFNDLEPGEYKVYIRDKNGCGSIDEDIYLMYYPKYFTPNGDSYHEIWQIKLARKEPNLEIYIHDRYGKVLAKLNPLSPGWDGRYQGELMPTDDYWFVVKRPSNGKTYKGHFTLKR